MGSRGGNAPNPYTQRNASTLFLRVPGEDWPRVKIGEKTEFRTVPRENLRLTSANTPTPVVAYAIRGGRHDARLMVLEEIRREPVWAISEDPEAIAREGFESYDHFRRYWRKRRAGRYMPMEMVVVWRLRPFQDRDFDQCGVRLLRHLYGDFLADL